MCWRPARDRADSPLNWPSSGGAVEPDDESLEATLRRELAEELGAKVIWGLSVPSLVNAVLPGEAYEALSRG
jgi:8-oxo-dGTP pyrophosphatase MutT (NUDIX family)